MAQFPFFSSRAPGGWLDLLSFSRRAPVGWQGIEDQSQPFPEQIPSVDLEKI